MKRAGLSWPRATLLLFLPMIPKFRHIFLCCTLGWKASAPNPVHALQLPAALLGSSALMGGSDPSKSCKSQFPHGLPSITCSGLSTCQCSFHSCHFTSTLFKNCASSKTSSITCAPPLQRLGSCSSFGTFQKLVHPGAGLLQSFCLPFFL